MTKHILSSLSLIILLLVSLSVKAQDVYSVSNAHEFAKYLEKNHEIDLAIAEYERLIYMSPENMGLFKDLFHLYLFKKDYQSIHNRYNHFLKGKPDLNISIQKQYIGALFNLNKFETAKQLYSNTSIIKSSDHRHLFLMNDFIHNKDWQQVDSVYQLIADPAIKNTYKNTLHQIQHIKYRNPAVAAVVSAFIPGLGKVYNKEYVDAVMSFFTVSSFTWQAYRGFSKKGTDSALGWIFGSASIVFYTGNIFGSHKAVKKYNQGIDAKIIEKNQAIFDSIDLQ